MKKIVIIILSIILFSLAFRVRQEFLSFHDYNDPSDAHEYFQGSYAVPVLGNLLKGFIIGKGLNQPTWIIKHDIGLLNTHGSPLYITYLDFVNKNSQVFALIISSLFAVFIFLISRPLVPIGISIVIGVISIVYTPSFAFIFSWMPESFTAVAIPVLAITASLLVIRSKNRKAYLLVGLILALMGFARHVFTWYGIFFIVIWILMKPKPQLKNILVLISGYLFPTIIWSLLVKWSGEVVYPVEGIKSTIFTSHNLVNSGWSVDGTRGLTWPGVFSRIVVHQNQINLLLLELERFGRFLRYPGNSYTGGFPLSQTILSWIHLLIIFFAVWGLRSAFRSKFIVFISSVIIWNTVFVSAYYLEELRYQIPVAGLLILLSGVGMHELLKYLNDKKTKFVTWLVLLSFGFVMIIRSHIIGIEMQLLPVIKNADVWRLINLFTLFVMSTVIVVKLWMHDKNVTSVFRYRWPKLIFLLAPTFSILVMFATHFRSQTWHQWRAPLKSGDKIEQTIMLTSEQITSLNPKKGYLIIDIADPNSAKFLEIKLNNEILFDRLAMNKKTSPVDLMAVRQWQRAMPRLGGFKAVEDVVATASAWPNLHEWLVVPFFGDKLKEQNQITIENTNSLSANLPIVYGDYPPYGNENYYEGPIARIFSGFRTHNKYQVDGDMRLTERRRLLSINNSSQLILNGREDHSDDLSSDFGKQSGRYRIFLLFPYISNDPEDLF